MNFRQLARIFLLPADDEDIDELEHLLVECYCDGLKACSWRTGGIDYLFDGPGTKQLKDVLEQVRRTREPV